MASIDQIISVTISQETKAVPQVGFGIPLIIGTSDRFVDLIRYYTDTNGMLADGFMTSDPEYIHAQEAFSQTLRPSQVGIGKNTTSVAQVDTFAVNTVTSTHQYTFTLNGTVISYTALISDAQQDILNGLLTAIGVAFPSNPPVSGAVTGTGGSALLTLTSTTAGIGVTYTAVDSLLTYASVTPNHSITTDIAAIQAVSDIWYGLISTSKASNDILQIAGYIEAQKKIYIASSSDSGILTTSTTDIASTLKDASYNRSGVLYSAAPNAGPDAAWVGGQLPQVPGASTWKFKTLVGIDPDNLSSTQRTNAIGVPISAIPGKNANIYETVGGVPITEEGWMASGQFIDVTIGVDWLESTIQTNIFQILTSLPKVPYTDKGGSLIEAAIRQAIGQGVTNGLIDGASPITVTIPPVLSVPVNSRAARILPDITFSCRLAGAFHFVVINGTVTV